MTKRQAEWNFRRFAALYSGPRRASLDQHRIHIEMGQAGPLSLSAIATDIWYRQDKILSQPSKDLHHSFLCFEKRFEFSEKTTLTTFFQYSTERKLWEWSLGRYRTNVALVFNYLDKVWKYIYIYIFKNVDIYELEYVIKNNLFRALVQATPTPT